MKLGKIATTLLLSLSIGLILHTNKSYNLSADLAKVDASTQYQSHLPTSSIPATILNFVNKRVGQLVD